jgi:hypothetical protein
MFQAREATPVAAPMMAKTSLITLVALSLSLAARRPDTHDPLPSRSQNRTSVEVKQEPQAAR